MIQRHEWKWIVRPALGTFFGVYGLFIFGALLRAKPKPLDFVFGGGAVMALAVTGLVVWQILSWKRARIGAAAYEDFLKGGVGAVIVDGKTGKATPAADVIERKPD